MGTPFEVRTNLLLKNWLLSSVLSSRVGGYFTEYRSWVGWLFEDHTDLFGENRHLSDFLLSQARAASSIDSEQVGLFC